MFPDPAAYGLEQGIQALVIPDPAEIQEMLTIVFPCGSGMDVIGII